jgi:hypothetical protein
VDGYAFLLEEEHHTAVPQVTQISELPINFFSTELLEVDVANEKSLVSFMEKWGLPFSAYRFFPDPDDSPFENHGRKAHDISARISIRNTSLLQKHGEERYKETSRYTDLFIGISKSEAITTLETMQNGVKGLFKALDGSADCREHGTEKPFCRYNSDGEHLFLDYFNYGASNKYSIALLDEDGLFDSACGIEPSDRGLTSAICNQIIETIHDKRGWVRCKAEGCGRWFKSKRGTSAPRSNSEYCSVKCANRQIKRNQRKPKEPSDTPKA